MDVTRLAVLGVAGVAGIGAFLMVMSNRPQQAVEIVQPTQEKTVRVLVAAKEFQRGDRLDVDSTKWVEWPEKALSPSFMTEASGVTPNDLSEAVARTLIVENEPIIERKIVRAGSSGLLAAVVSPGMRAVTMRVNPETSVSGFVMPGDRVDVYYTEDDDEGNTQFSLLLQNVRVLAIDATYQENPESTNIPGANVTVELSPADAEYFTTARQSRGQMSLALRSVFEADDKVEQKRRSTDVTVIRYGRS